MKWWQVYSKVLPDLTNGFDVLTDSGKHSHQPCINLFVSTIMFNKNVQNEWNGHGPWPSALRHWLAMDHLALAVGCLLPANTLTDLGRQERRSSKSKWSPQKLHNRYYVQINLRNVVSKRNTTVSVRLRGSNTAGHATETTSMKGNLAVALEMRNARGFWTSSFIPCLFVCLFVYRYTPASFKRFVNKDIYLWHR